MGDKELEEERRFLLLSIFLHPVGKHELALFFLLASVFPTRFFHCRGFNEVDEDLMGLFLIWDCS